MLQKFPPLHQKALLMVVCCLLLFSFNADAQCGWLNYAPYISQPAVKMYSFQCGASNAIWITRCSTDKAVVNFDNTSACAPATDTNNYTYFGGPAGKLCKANAGSKIDLYVTTNLDPSLASTNSIPRLLVWVDWNHNHVFEETPGYTELVTYTKTSSSVNTSNGIIVSNVSGTHMLQFEVPEYAKNGPTRMRIRLGGIGKVPSPSLTITGGGLTSCNLTDHGECEDYDFEIINPCRPPDIISVSNVTCKGADICWSLMKHMETYDYWVGTTPLPPNPVPIWGYPLSESSCRTVPNITYSSILPETKYYIAVRNICDTFAKPWQLWHMSGWQVDSFKTLPCCDAPLNLRINNITATAADVTWDPVHTAGKYEYVITTTPGNPQSGGTILTGTSLTVQGLAPGKTYYFCVRALCSPTPLSDWACVPLSTLGPTSVGAVSIGNENIRAYPNPVKNTLTVSLKAGTGGELTITDIAGRVVYTRRVNTAEVTINTSAWQKGLYLVHYRSADGIAVVKITKE